MPMRPPPIKVGGHVAIRTKVVNQGFLPDLAVKSRVEQVQLHVERRPFHDSGQLWNTLLVKAANVQALSLALHAKQGPTHN